MATHTLKTRNDHKTHLTHCTVCERKLPNKNYHGICATCRKSQEG